MCVCAVLSVCLSVSKSSCMTTSFVIDQRSEDTGQGEKTREGRETRKGGKQLTESSGAEKKTVKG